MGFKCLGFDADTRWYRVSRGNAHTSCAGATTASNSDHPNRTSSSGATTKCEHRCWSQVARNSRDGARLER